MSGNTLLRLPIALFSSSMGVAGLASAIKASQISLLAPLITPLAMIAALILMVMLISTLAKVAYDFKGIRQEVMVATKRNFLSCVTITLFLLSGLMADYHDWPILLWKAGILIQIPLLSAILISWLVSGKKIIKELNPTFLIPPLANVVSSIFTPGMYAELGLSMYLSGLLIGTVIYLIVLTKTLQGKTPPVPLYPTLFIGLATPSMFLLGYLNVTGESSVIVSTMYVWALLIFAVLVAHQREFKTVSFGVPMWAFTFPLAAFTIATYELSFMLFGHLLLILTTIVISSVSVKTIFNFKEVLNR